MPEPLTIWVKILPSLDGDPTGSRGYGDGMGQIDRKVRGSSGVRQIEVSANQCSGKIARAIAVKVNVERRRGTASFGIFTHHAHSSDENVDTRGRSGQDEVVSRLVVERGHRRLEVLRADVDRRFRCGVVVLIVEDEARWKFPRWQSGRVAVAVARSDGKLHRAPGRGLLFSGSLCECEWDRAHGDQEKQVKRASNKMRFNPLVNALFHNSDV